ncbi:MAG: hypothetical protein Q8908_00265 [Bacteroidota bacterium]|nr:hypothetical protein [Bacteroidota bacterium]
MKWKRALLGSNPIRNNPAGWNARGGQNAPSYPWTIPTTHV